VQKISFGGKEYIRASEVAKKFRYTQDYVGQLCRSKKVEARRVGRVWYVEPFSVSAYRQTKHQSMKKTSEAKGSVTLKTSEDKNSSSQASRPSNVRKKPSKAVEPVLRSKTARLASGKTKKAKTIPKTSYDSDEEVLVPIINSTRKKNNKKAAPKKTVRIEQQHVHRVSIVSETKKGTNFSPEKLPEISLSGKLKVEESRKEAPFADANEEDSVQIEDQIPSVSISAVEDAEFELQTADEYEIDFDFISDEQVEDIESRTSQSTNFAPSTVLESLGNTSWLSLPQVIVLVTVISIGASLLILGLESNLVVTTQSENASLRFGIDRLF